MAEIEEVSVATVSTELDEDGRFHVVVDLPSGSLRIDSKDAQGWAWEILQVVAFAEHDAAVVRQLRSVGIPEDLIGSLVLKLREDRPPTVQSTLIPALVMRPAIGSDLVPVVEILHEGEFAGWLPVSQARAYAVEVMDAILTCPLDQTYLDVLVRGGTPLAQAVNIVGGVAEFRSD